jgi:hypothetical protein
MEGIRFFYIGRVVRVLIKPGTNYLDDSLFTRVSALHIPQCYFKMEQDHSLQHSFRSIFLIPSFLFLHSDVTPKVAALSLRKPASAEINPLQLRWAGQQ